MNIAPPLFRPPPDVPQNFRSSAVVVGAHGSGKTSLLRHLGRTHRGVAIQLSLLRTLGALARFHGDSGADPTRVDALRGRSESLLALAIAQEALALGLTVDTDALVSAVSCAPSPAHGALHVNTVAAWRERVLNARDEDCLALGGLRPFVASLASQCARAGESLLLTVDDAELVRSDLLAPVASLLAPTTALVTLIALRPGVRLPEADAVHPIAVTHIGARPRSAAWTTHVAAVLGQSHRDLLDSLSEDLRDLLLAIARDSIGTALALLVATSVRRDRAEGLSLAATHLRALRLGAARASFVPFNANFEDFLGALRQRMLRDHGRIPGPVTLTISPLAGQLAMFPGTSRFQRFADVAVRTGALSLPEGETWGAEENFDALEVAPVLLWTDLKTFARGADARPITLATPSSALFRRRGRALRPPTVFVVCDGAHQTHPCPAESWQQVASASYASPGLQFRGHPPARAEVTTITHAAALIAASASARMLFQIGVAYQAGTPVLLARIDAASPLLASLAARPTPSASAVLGELTRILARRGDSGVRRPPRPVPGVIEWLGDRALTESFDACKSIADIAGLHWEHVSEPDPTVETLDRLLRAQVLIVPYGQAPSVLVHLVAGAFAAQPTAGYGTSAAPRRLILITTRVNAVPEYAGSARGTVLVVPPNAARSELLDATRSVRAWPGARWG